MHCEKYVTLCGLFWWLCQIVQCNLISGGSITRNSQDMEKILQNIEVRLQVLDNIERAIDKINTRINRLENMLQTRLENIDSDINIKYEHVSRKIDTTYDRYVHRFNNYWENKFEKDIKKIESKIETHFHQLDRMEINFGSRQEFIETEIGENSEILKDLHENMKIENNTKIDMNKKLISMEKLITDNNYLLNSTKKECQDNTRAINGLNRKTTSLNQNLSNDINKSLSGLGGMIQKKFSHMNQKIDSNFNNTMLAHNLFLESCHRIQLDEPQMEAKIVQVVETLLSLITNKTTNMGGEIHYLQDLLRSHDSEIQNKVGLTKNTLLEMAQKSFTYKQETVDTLMEVKNNLNQWLNSTTNILNTNKMDQFEKLEAIDNTLQNVHSYILNIHKNRELELNLTRLIGFIEKAINTTKSNHSTKLEQHFEAINNFLSKIHDKIEKQSIARYRSKNSTNLIKHDDMKSNISSVPVVTFLDPQITSNDTEIDLGTTNDTISGTDTNSELDYLGFLDFEVDDSDFLE